MSRVLVTGGTGFLGSHVVRRLLAGDHEVLNVDLLTYAGSPARLADIEKDPRYRFARADIVDEAALKEAMGPFRAEAVVHLAAESHVTRSEGDPERFWRTNVEGTRRVLERSAGAHRLVHVSTDEVYGPILDGAFREEDKEPGEGAATSAYARSKAIADDLAREWGTGLEVVVVRPTNCFGPWQYPEKAFPRWVTRALAGATVPVWGDGRYVRQWLAAEDLAEAIALVLETATPHPVYNIGPRHEPEITNVALARWLVSHLGLPEDRMVFTVYDRPDHDRRYAVDPSRIESLGWKPRDPWDRFAETVEWYRRNEGWWRPLVPEAEAIYQDEAAR